MAVGPERMDKAGYHCRSHVMMVGRLGADPGHCRTDDRSLWRTAQVASPRRIALRHEAVGKPVAGLMNFQSRSAPNHGQPSAVVN